MIRPEIGAVYRGADGYAYRCLGGSRIFGTTRLRDMRSGHVFTALNARLDRNGQLRWDRRTSGDRRPTDDI